MQICFHFAKMQLGPSTVSKWHPEGLFKKSAQIDLRAKRQEREGRREGGREEGGGKVQMEEGGREEGGGKVQMEEGSRLPLRLSARER